MSVCGQNGHAEDDSASEEVAAQIGNKTSDIYKQKPASKVVRVLTVLAYLFSVSLAAILLSVYYICVWKSPELPLSERVELSARRGHRSDYGDADYGNTTFHVNGGGDTAVNSSTASPLENITSGYQNVSEYDSTTGPAQYTTVPTDDATPQGTHNETSDDIDSFNSIDSIT